MNSFDFATALAAGATIVTPNNRLARHLVARFDDAQRADGKRTWAAARALPWGAWLETLWLDALAASVPFATLKAPVAVALTPSATLKWPDAVAVSPVARLRAPVAVAARPFAILPTPVAVASKPFAKETAPVAVD